MKKILLIFPCFWLTLFVSAQSSLNQLDPDTTRLRLNAIVDKWHHDAASGNHEAYIGAMTSDGVFIGTDATEYWTTPQFSAWCKPYFDKKKSWKFTAFQRNIYTARNGKTAWFDELLNTQMGLCRGSGVLVEQDGNWKIAQYVLSSTIPNLLMKQVTAMKSAADSALIMKNIFDKNGMTGTILILDPDKGKYFGYNSARWDSSYLPASTFKIPNTLIGLETGVIDTGYVFKWKGEKRRLPQWEKDLTLREAFRVSCVPCYQELARKIGPDRMKSTIEKMAYPGMDVQAGNIDLFWLEGDSRITPRQQVEFLRRLYEEKLPLKTSVMQEVKAIMMNETTPEYTLSGKTGWAIRNGKNRGWFVGWIETKAKTYFVATLVEPKNQEQTSDFTAARRAITLEVFKIMGLISSGEEEPGLPGH